MEEIKRIAVNLEKMDIIYVRASDSEKCGRVIYKQEKKHIFSENQKEGYYIQGHYSDTFLEKEPIGYFLKDKIAYYKPKCLVMFSNGYHDTTYFNTYQEALELKKKIQSII